MNRKRALKRVFGFSIASRLFAINRRVIIHVECSIKHKTKVQKSIQIALFKNFMLMAYGAFNYPLELEFPSSQPTFSSEKPLTLEF